MRPFETLKAWARRIRQDVLTLWFAARHAATPWYAKALGAFVVAYALSPIDLIPDFIPILGYLDEVILLPVLIWMTIRMLPAEVLADSRARADDWIAVSASVPRSWVDAVGVVTVWLLVAAGSLMLSLKVFSRA